MCKAIAILLAVLLFTPALFAKGNHDWKHLEKLKPGSTVLISTLERATYQRKRRCGRPGGVANRYS